MAFDNPWWTLFRAFTGWLNEWIAPKPFWKEISFNGFIDWTLKLRKDLNIPHKLSEVIEEKDFDINRLSKMALEDPSTGGNPKKLTVEDMKIMYEHSMSGNLFL